MTFVPDNVVLFELNGEVWRLSNVCSATAGASIVIGIVLLMVVLRHYGTAHSLSADEAASISMHAGEVREVDRAVASHAAATGSEFNVSMSIGDFRDAWRQKNWFRFFGLPFALLFLWEGFGIGAIGMWLRDHTWVSFSVALLIGVPMPCVILFCWWAAIFTELE